MNPRAQDLLARHCLLHLDEVAALWHRREWARLAVVVAYAERGVPAEMSKSDPFMYRKLCAGLCEYHIRGFDRFSLERLQALAAAQPAPPPFPA